MNFQKFKKEIRKTFSPECCFDFANSHGVCMVTVTYEEVSWNFVKGATHWTLSVSFSAVMLHDSLLKAIHMAKKPPKNYELAYLPKLDEKNIILYSYPELFAALKRWVEKCFIWETFSETSEKFLSRKRGGKPLMTCSDVSLATTLGWYQVINLQWEDGVWNFHFSVSCNEELDKAINAFFALLKTRAQ